MRDFFEVWRGALHVGSLNFLNIDTGIILACDPVSTLNLNGVSQTSSVTKHLSFLIFVLSVHGSGLLFQQKDCQDLYDAIHPHHVHSLSNSIFQSDLVFWHLLGWCWPQVPFDLLGKLGGIAFVFSVLHFLFSTPLFLALFSNESMLSLPSFVRSFSCLRDSSSALLKLMAFSRVRVSSLSSRAWSRSELIP